MTVLRRIGSAVGVLAFTAATVVTGGSVAGAEEAGIAAHRVWSCSVPSDHTFSRVRINTNCGFRYEYFLLDPVNNNLTGQYACTIPSGYTYTSSRQGNNCSPNGLSWEYRLAK